MAQFYRYLIRLREASRRVQDDRAASLVEYALLVALIALVCFAAVGFLGGSTQSEFDGVGSSFAGFSSN